MYSCVYVIKNQKDTSSVKSISADIFLDFRPAGEY